MPPALKQVVLDFDRDGRLDVARPADLRARTDRGGQRRRSADASARARSSAPARSKRWSRLASGPVPTSSPLTLFNGPRQEGHPTVLVHAHTHLPATQTYAFLVPIEKRRGEFRYRATADFPPLAGGLGAITKIKIKVGRRYTAGGVKRSYVSARCSDHILRSHGAFTFAGGLVIEGVGLEKYCAQRRSGRIPIILGSGPLAQLVEQETLNLKVDGSSPSRPTRRKTSCAQAPRAPSGAIRRGWCRRGLERVLERFLAGRFGLLALLRDFFEPDLLAEFFGVFFDFFELVFEGFAFELGVREFGRFFSLFFGLFVVRREEGVDRRVCCSVPRLGRCSATSVCASVATSMFSSAASVEVEFSANWNIAGATTWATPMLGSFTAARYLVQSSLTFDNWWRHSSIPIPRARTGRQVRCTSRWRW